MGGRGSGGRRIGAGRKRKDNVVAFTHGSRQRVDAPQKPPTPTHVDPPSDITDPERGFWDLYAPDAMQLGRLTPHNARAFVFLVCQPLVIFARIMKDLDDQGWTYQKESEFGHEPKKHQLITDLNFWHRRADAGMAQFGLAPMGKVAEQPATEVDPFAEFEAQG